MNKSAVLQGLLKEGVERRVFPSAQATVLHRGQSVFEATAGDVESDTCFDLASLTKVICTTSVFMTAWASGEIEPTSKAGQGEATWADLLYHRSGLPAFVPFFAAVFRRYPELMSASCPAAVRLRAREDVTRAAKEVPLQGVLGQTSIYSDVGFIILGDALEQRCGLALDRLFERRVARPLGLSTRFHRLSDQKQDWAAAPTGTSRPREPAPGQEGLWQPLQEVPSRSGEVDDDNAYCMDGVAAHAGLFGSSRDVAGFGQIILEDFGGAGRLAPKSLWRRALCRDSQTPGSTRAMGFDTPADDPRLSSAGRFIGRIFPGAVGHLGFTGTSLWIDLARELVVALCTNRTYFGRANQAILEFRPRFHDAVVTALDLEEP